MAVIDARLRLTVLAYVSAAFTDRSEEALDYSRDNFAVTLATTSFLYLGYRKPFGAAYAELVTPNVTANSLAFTYWNGTEWAALNSRDLTKGLTRSGWFAWTKPADWTANAVDGSTLFWVRCAPSVTHTATTVAGLNLVFADDYDLQTEFPNALDTAFIPAGETTHIKTHVAVRNQLIQDLRDKGYIKQDSDGNWLNLTPWDLHDIEEVRQAATYLALSKIFFNYSDNPSDHWTAKSKAFEAKYNSALSKVRLSIDADDDGEESNSERAKSATVTRMYR